MAAITASLAMSSQVGRHRRAQEVGGERELQPEQDPGGEFEPDLAAHHLVGGTIVDRHDDVDDGLEGAEAYNENGAALDGERDIARDLVELLLERYDRFPRFPP